MFISYDEWNLLDIFHPDEDYSDFRSSAWYEYYYYKWYYAELSKSKRILEIGVRLGYSAFAFMSSSYCEEYTGWDIQKPIDGGMTFDTTDWVKDKVFSKFPSIKSNLETKDTQIDEWLSDEYDFIHVDGSHSYFGALSDCSKAYSVLSKGGLMVVDDYVFIPAVKKAVDCFLDEKDLPLVVGYSKRGDALLWKI